MSNYLTNNEASERAKAGKSRCKLWLASGVAGLTGVVSIAAVGVAGSAGAVGESSLKWSTAQQVSKDGDQGRQAEDSDRYGKDHERGKEVPCKTDALIQAITFANANHGGVLELAKSCTYNLTRNQHGNGLPVITERIVLKGDHTVIGRDATAEQFRILNVGPGGHLTLKGLAIKGGQTLPYLHDLAPEAVWSMYSDSVQLADQVKAGTPLDKALAARQAAPKATLKAAPKATPKADTVTPLVQWPGYFDGAGILVQPGAAADLYDTEVAYNQAGVNGGGIANFGTTKLVKSTVAHNTAFFFGGGILNAGLLKVDESKIKDNTAIIGGAGISNGAPSIFKDDIDGGSAWIHKSEISDNETLGFGGGLLDVKGTTTIHNSKIISNTAVLAGGAIATADAQLNLKKTTVAHNSTAGAGGGLAITFGSAATIEDSQIKENTAGFFGAGLFNTLSVTTLRNTEILGNRAIGPFGVGGGTFNLFGKVNLHTTKIAYNFATHTGGGIFTYPNGVQVDNKSTITANRPNNCAGSHLDNCFD